MPGGRGKATRACGMCKPYKRAGNAAYRYTEREQATREALDEAVEDALVEMLDG